jgi:HEPN domain-containing protein
VAFIRQARRQLRSALLAGVDAESSFGLSYQAAIKGLTGALIAVGRRVTAGESGHLVLIREARGRLGGEEALFDRLDRMRRTRHEVFYEVAEVSRRELETAQRDAQALIDLSARFVMRQAERSS